MSTLQEVQKAYKILKKNSSKEIVVMHCTTEYPAPINEMNINCISTLKKIKVHCWFIRSLPDKYFFNCSYFSWRQSN